MAAAHGSTATSGPLVHANGGPCIGDTSSNGMAAAGGDAAALKLLQEFLQVQSQRAEVYSMFNQGFRDFLDHGQEASLARLMQGVTPAFSAASQQVRSIEAALKSPAIDRPDLAALLRRVQDTERDKLTLTLSWQSLRAAHAAGRFSWQEAADRPRAGGPSHTQPQQQQQQLLTLLERVRLETAGGGSHPGGLASDTASTGRDQGGSQSGGFISIKPGFYAEQMQRAAVAATAASAPGGVTAGASASTPAAEQAQQLQPSCAAGASHACQHHCHGHHQHEAADPLELGTPLEPTEAEYNAAVREALQQLDACVVGINDALEEVREAMADLQE